MVRKHFFAIELEDVLYFHPVNIAVFYPEFLVLSWWDYFAVEEFSIMYQKT